MLVYFTLFVQRPYNYFLSHQSIVSGMGHPIEHRNDMSIQSEQIIQYFEKQGIQVFLSSKNHHRKLAIIDRKILWEGSLNILSQTKSREIMRRIDSQDFAEEMLEFIKLKPYL